jgi:type I restriction enzyme S subunit
MAKGKKAAALTPEERLKQALVPVEEQPYKVPGNWCWTTVGIIATVVTGGTPRKKDPEYYGNEFPFFKPSDLDSGRHVYVASEYLSDLGKKVARIVPAESTAVCCIGSIGKSGFLEIEGTTNQQINSAIPRFNPLYQYYYMNTVSFVNQLWSKSSATTISIVNKAKMESCYFPLAPLPEQQRIVDRIESLFAKLDEAKEKAQAVVDGFELRKSAILHKAFTGELTKEWRQEHSVKVETWKKVAMQDVCEKIACGKTPTGHIYPTSDIPYLKVYNIVNDAIDFETTPQFIPREIHENKLKSSMLKPNDVIMNIVGPPLRKIAIVPDTYPEWNMNQAIVRFRPQKELYYRFLYYTLVNPETLEDIISATRGVVGQANISVSQSRELLIMLPTMNEQLEIVRILDDLLSKEQQAKDAAEAVLDQIDTMKKAILARAFRGELGTNDPTEKSAVELLKGI